MGPEILLLVAVAATIGAAIGTFTGAVPGIHVNTAASLLVSAYPAAAEALSGTVGEELVPVLFCCGIFSASTVHSFVDFVPSVFIGAPDPDEMLSVLPGHRLLLQGKGMRAVRAAAVGSAVGACSALLIAVPMQWVMMNGAADFLDGITTAVVALCLGLVWYSSGNRIGAVPVILTSGIAGIAVNSGAIPCTGVFGEGTLLFPMLTGMFGIPPLLERTGKRRIPPQKDEPEDCVGPLPGLKGVLTGALAGWFPGVTSTVGATIASMFGHERSPEAFISMVASVGTVTSVMSVVALSVSGSGRSGTAAAAKDIIGDGLGGFCGDAFVAVLVSMAVASAFGYIATIGAGRFMSAVFGRIPEEKLSAAVLVFVTVLVALFTGPFGLAVLAVSAALGMVPPAIGVSRVAMTACLMSPTILGSML